MSRIVCISNRVFLPDPETGEIRAGGLAVGVKAGLESNGGGVWFGWDGSVCKADGKKRVVTKIQHGDITFLTIPLREQEYDAYYKGMANENLWPLMHGLGEHIEIRPNVYYTYKQVNKMFARRIKPYLRPGDLIWVHDYHVIPLGKELRALGIRNRIGYFHHIPIPSHDFIENQDIPEFLKKQYKQLLTDLFYYDLVGFQSFRDFRNFSGCLDRESHCPLRYQSCALQYKSYRTRFGVFPISIETYDIALACKRNREQNLKRNDCKTLIGAERLDYTKGLTYRLSGYHEFLDCNPEYHGRIQYHQITPLSRADIWQYKIMIEETRHLVQGIQENFGNESMQPLIYSEKALPRKKLMNKLRHSDVGLVTPLIDGQNLVAKEFIAAQDPYNPGMLVLSKNAGAVEELKDFGVLCVDPLDPSDIAKKIVQALKTLRLERIEIYRKAISYLYRYDIEHWVESFLHELYETRRSQPYENYRSGENVLHQNNF